MNTKILWDENGQVACEKHVPHRGSDTWRSGRWRAITTNEWVDFTAEVGRAPSCETCDAIVRNTKGGAA